MSTEPFVPSLEAPESWTAALTVAVRGGDVVLVDEPPEVVAPGAPSIVLGTLGGIACWAIDLDGDGRPDEASLDVLDALMPLMGLWGRVDERRWTLAGRAVQLVEWERTHRFCGSCAMPTEASATERARRCPSCGLLAFPRLAPAVIVLVERDGKALLARNANFPLAMFSCLAGFVEPGETLEECVAREVREEVGIEVTDVTYWASQPWPFPHSLMLGFTARWAGGEVAVDGVEIAEADWFGPEELPTIPPAMSIARRLIDDWLARSGPLDAR